MCKPRIYPMDIRPGMKLEDLVSVYRGSGAFQGGRLGAACALYEKMCKEQTTIALTIAGAMTPAGMGGTIIPLMKNGLIDFVISTGANLYHDIHFALDLEVYQGNRLVDDRKLLKAGVERIYDIFITEELLLRTDKFIKDEVRNFPADKPISTAQLHYLLGKSILKKTPYPERSILAVAAKLDIPVYTSSPGDSSLGMNLSELKMKGHNLIIDPDLDVLETTAIIYCSKINGVIILGGGSPKNFYLQTQPMLWGMIRSSKRGHDFDIQISTDAPHWGGLSGATPSEAVSWGKVNPNRLEDSIVVYSDATIAFPILSGYILSKAKKRPLKRLFKKRIEFMKKLKTLAKKSDKEGGIFVI